ncbi:twin-arginine translocase subunit TatC [Desulfosporosinus metallidurans]|uniref:Sec-independent protein translocase protein TatC n=1 Tax=Desulfosporosinus metallidurans TaxID=1888891 RepID=A0A1Q8QW98_9FIRM|nr:twin-arginine translocase subunit TatC [Desulfosporosinus metallidurans]OLN31602.1 Twin-arginine translocation protein TatC [Desulfosporosinus metallidurans]
MRRRKRQLNEGNLPLMEHVIALRKVLVISAYAIAFGAIVGWFISDLTFTYLATPVTKLKDIMFITTTPMEPMLVKLKVSLFVGMVIALPIIIWQIWSFVLPALKQNERKYLYIIVPSSLLLFLAGAALCFYVVLPIGIRFLLMAGGGGVQSTPFVTKTSYLSFLVTFLLTFGLVFQLPIVLLILIRIGVLSPKTLAKKRRWAVLAIVILAAVVAPTPDLFTQLLMAGPMYLLYEISIWLGYLVVRRTEKELALK